MKHKIVISGLFGENNAGDELLLYKLLDGLFNNFEIETISIFSSDVQKTINSLTINGINTGKIQILYSGRWGLLESNKKFPESFSWLPKTIKTIRKSDILITGPGNVIKDNTNAFFLIFWLAKVFIAFIFSKKYCFLGIGAIGLNHSWSKLLFSLLKNKSLFFSTRDSRSATVLKKLKVKPDKIFAYSDLSFYDIRTTAAKTPDRKVVGVNLRSFSTKHYSEEIINSYYAEIFEFLCFLNKNKEYEFKFIPFCTESHQNDLLALEKLNSFKHLDFPNIEIVNWNTFAELENEFSKCHAFIGTRFHSSCISIQNGIPLIALSYDDKTHNLMHDIDMPEYCLKIPEITFKGLKNIWETIESNRSEIKSKEINAVSKYSILAEKHFELLTNHLTK